jgi:hypothetical protein
MADAQAAEFAVMVGESDHEAEPPTSLSGRFWGENHCTHSFE